jgi:formylglycine-generating enzyme required for sulfatase activity
VDFSIGFRCAVPVEPLTTQTTVIQTPSPEPANVSSTQITDDKGAEMVLVPAGDFIMGDDNENNNERPAHQVYIDSFYIDKYEVSNEHYKTCVDAGHCQPPNDVVSSEITDYYINPKFDNYPVINIDWDMADKYCTWRDADLPTEAQWEKAARGTDGRSYPWGNEFAGNEVNFCDVNCSTYWGNKNYNDEYGNTAPVDSFLQGVSPYGIYNMAGNAWEWVADWYSEKYYQNSPSANPTGPTTGDYRVLRGGSWFSTESQVRSSYRYGGSPTNGYIIAIGFRCAVDVTP